MHSTLSMAAPEGPSHRLNAGLHVLCLGGFSLKLQDARGLAVLKPTFQELKYANMGNAGDLSAGLGRFNPWPLRHFGRGIDCGCGSGKQQMHDWIFATRTFRARSCPTARRPRWCNVNSLAPKDLLRKQREAVRAHCLLNCLG